MDDEALVPVALEQRWQRLREAAEAIDSAVAIHVTVGGIDVTERYRIREERTKPQTLAEFLETAERVVADPLTAQVARATLRMRAAEHALELITSHTVERQKEYKVAFDAFTQAHSDDLRETEQDIDRAIVTLLDAEARNDSVELARMVLGRKGPEPEAEEEPEESES